MLLEFPSTRNVTSLYEGGWGDFLGCSTVSVDGPDEGSTLRRLEDVPSVLAGEDDAYDDNDEGTERDCEG